MMGALKMPFSNYVLVQFGEVPLPTIFQFTTEDMPESMNQSVEVVPLVRVKVGAADPNVKVFEIVGCFPDNSLLKPTTLVQ